MLTFGVCLHDCFTKAFFVLDVPMGGTIDPTVDFDMTTDALFSAVPGTRYSASKEFLRNPNTRPNLASLAIVLEPIRTLTSWWMRRAREQVCCTCAVGP